MTDPPIPPVPDDADAPTLDAPTLDAPAADDRVPGEAATVVDDGAVREDRAAAGAALAYGWTTFRAHARPMLVVVAVPVVAQLILAGASRAVFGSVARWFLFQIVSIVVGAVAAIGVPRMALMISAGETPDIGRAFRSERLGAWIAFSAVFGLLEGVGLVLCVIPGMLFLAYFGLAQYFFLDREMSIGEALRASRRAVVRDGLAFPVLLAIVIGLLGFAVVLVGALVTQSVAALALVFLYRHVTGEPVGA